MEAICNPLAEIGCEDILHVTQPRFKGGLNFSPFFPGFLAWMERGDRKGCGVGHYTSLAKPTDTKGQSIAGLRAQGKHGTVLPTRS